MRNDFSPIPSASTSTLLGSTAHVEKRPPSRLMEWLVRAAGSGSVPALPPRVPTGARAHTGQVGNVLSVACRVVERGCRGGHVHRHARCFAMQCLRRRDFLQARSDVDARAKDLSPPSTRCRRGDARCERIRRILGYSAVAGSAPSPVCTSDRAADRLTTLGNSAATSSPVVFTDDDPVR